MNLRLILAFCTITITMVLSSCSSTRYIYTSHESDWQNVGVLDGIETYIDTSTITKVGTTAFAFEKRVFSSEESRAGFVSKIEKTWIGIGKPDKVKDWNDFSYEIFYSEYDCLNKRYRVLQIEDFDSQGKKIVKTTPKGGKSEWMSISDESLGYHTLFFICDFDVKSK